MVLRSAPLVMTKLTLYSSSAGSGKTYTLTLEFLKLALVSPPGYFRHILAVTFTNKATAEMKERILKALHQISLGHESRLTGRIAKETGLEENGIISKAALILRDILHGYSYLSVSTIDTFFQKVIRSFSLEAGLPSGYRIELDTEKVLDEVTDKVIERAGTDKFLSAWLVDFTMAELDDDRSFNLKEKIKKLGWQLFSDDFRLIQQELFSDDFESRIIHFQKKLAEEKAKIISAMNGYGSKALSILAANGLSTDDLFQKKNGPGGYFERIASGSSAKAFEAKENVLKVYGGAEWVSKTSKKKSHADSAVAQGLQEILIASVDFWNGHKTLFNSMSEVSRNIYVFGLLNVLWDALKEYRNEHQVFLISDSAPFLNDIISGNDTPFIFEKTGNRYNHFFIDEFQDTSILQWENIRPLIMNSLSQGMSNLIVGDPKQSIYRFRGGEPDLLVNHVEEQVGKAYVETVPLKVNWRSRQEVISFNNRIFSQAPLLLTQKFLTDAHGLDTHSSAMRITSAYKDFYQELPEEPKKGGFVSLSFIPRDQETKWQEESLTRIPALVEELQDQGYALRDIAFLVRKKEHGTQIANTLSAYAALQVNSPYRYDVVSSESLVLSACPALHFIIAILQSIVDPADKLARAEAVFYYLHHVKSSEWSNDLLLQDDHRVFPEDFISKRQQISKMSAFDAVSEIIHIFSLNDFPQNSPYLQFFRDYILLNTSEGLTSLLATVKWWKEEGISKTVIISEDQDAMPVMTIHKSKGLEFKVVIIPFCEWDLGPMKQTSDVLWCSSTSYPLNEFPYLPVRVSSSLVETEFAAAYHDELLSCYLDNLNLLYVALTRAVDALYIHTPAPKEGQELNTISSLLVSCAGKEDVSFGEKAGILNSPEKHQSFPLSHTPVCSWHVRFNTGREPSGEAGFGEAVHLLFSRVVVQEDFPAELERARIRQLFTEEEAALVNQWFTQLLNEQIFHSWFSGSCRVLTEQEIVGANGNILRPDRVMISGKKAVVADFKTGAEADHSEQVASYVSALEQMGYEAEGWVVFLPSATLKKISL